MQDKNISDTERMRLKVLYKFLLEEGNKENMQIQRHTDWGYSAVKRVLWLGRVYGLITVVREPRGTLSGIYGVGSAPIEVIDQIPEKIPRYKEETNTNPEFHIDTPKPIMHEAVGRIIKERHPTRRHVPTGRVWVSGSSLTMI